MTKRGRGRPSKYRPEFCQMLLDHMGSQGLSYQTFAAKIGVHKDSLFEWEKCFPEWVEAKELAMNLNLMFWERIGIDGALGKIMGFNATAWIVNMKNRHKWRDKHAIEVEGKVDHDHHHTHEHDVQSLITELKEILIKPNEGPRKLQ